MRKVVALVGEAAGLFLEIHSRNVHLIERVFAHVDVLKLREDEVKGKIAKRPDFLGKNLLNYQKFLKRKF